MAQNQPSAAEAKKEADRQAAERLMAGIREQIAQMRSATPSAAESIHKRLKDQCADKRLSPEFKRGALEQAKAGECAANMRAADKALAEAARLSAGEHMKERGVKLAEGRALFSKACTLGAGDDFRRASQRLIDTIMMTGGVQHSGPTRAKPLAIAPKTPDRVHAPDKGPKAPDRAHG